MDVACKRSPEFPKGSKLALHYCCQHDKLICTVVAAAVKQTEEQRAIPTPGKKVYSQEYTGKVYSSRQREEQREEKEKLNSSSKSYTNVVQHETTATSTDASLTAAASAILLLSRVHLNEIIHLFLKVLMQAIDYTKPSLKEYSNSSLKQFMQALKEQFQLFLINWESFS